MRRTILLATVVDPVRGRDVVTLQACTMPDFENRLSSSAPIAPAAPNSTPAGSRRPVISKSKS